MNRTSPSYLREINAYYTHDGKYLDGYPSEVLNIIRREKLFKCFLPERLGGLGMTLSDTLEVIDDLSHINGSLGWLIQIGNGGNYFAAYFNEETSKELFGPAEAVLAGSGAVTGTATPVEGGYRISGQWRFCSGADHASFFTCSARVADSEQVISCAVLPEDVKVIRDWKTIGLQYTSTHSIKIENAFVPMNRVFNLEDRRSQQDTAIFYFPFLAYAQAFFLSNIYGLFRRFCEEASLVAEQHNQRWKELYPERYAHVTGKSVAGLEMLKTSQKELREFVHVIETSGSSIRDAAVRSLDTFTREQTRKIREEAHALFPLLGMDALYTTGPIGVFYADLQCTTQHMLLNRY